MDFLDLADDAVPHDAHRRAERRRRVHMDSHLGHEFLLVGNLHHAAHFVEVVGERLLAVDVIPICMALNPMEACM